MLIDGKLSFSKREIRCTGLQCECFSSCSLETTPFFLIPCWFYAAFCPINMSQIADMAII